MKDLRNDRFQNTTTAQDVKIELGTPYTPHVHNIELLEEPPHLVLPLSELYELFIQEDRLRTRDARENSTSSSHERIFGQLRRQISFSLNAMTKNLSDLFNNSYDRRDLLRLKKSRTSIYSFMCINPRPVRRWNRPNFVRCR